MNKYVSRPGGRGKAADFVRMGRIANVDNAQSCQTVGEVCQVTLDEYAVSPAGQIEHTHFDWIVRIGEVDQAQPARTISNKGDISRYCDAVGIARCIQPADLERVGGIADVRRPSRPD